MTDDRFPPIASQDELDHENMSDLQFSLNGFAWAVLAMVVLILCVVGYVAWKVLT